jgi:hypothetical protein
VGPDGQTRAPEVGLERSARQLGWTAGYRVTCLARDGYLRSMHPGSVSRAWPHGARTMTALVLALDADLLDGRTTIS